MQCAMAGRILVGHFEHLAFGKSEILEIMGE